jgi:arabinose-5-phosphate isomerase
VLKDLFKAQQAHLSHFYNALDIEQAQRVLEVCAQTQGFLIFLGVGKSGIIAEKIAMTLVSTGTKALYLPTTNLLHGDIGLIGSQDTVIMISKSGETEELLSLIPFIRRKGAYLISWVSNRKSRLAYQADLSLILPVEKELCPFDLAPTTSTEVQLLFGDAIAIALMKEKQVSLKSYGENHPSGSIGKKATLQVKDLMVQTSELPLCPAHVTLQIALPQFSEKRAGCLLITNDEHHFEGIFTDGDLRRALQTMGPDVMQKTLGELMNRTALTTHPQETAWQALKLMQKDPKRWIMVLPVLEGPKIVGLVRMHDIIHAGIE